MYVWIRLEIWAWQGMILPLYLYYGRVSALRSRGNGRMAGFTSCIPTNYGHMANTMDLSEPFQLTFETLLKVYSMEVILQQGISSDKQQSIDISKKLKTSDELQKLETS